MLAGILPAEGKYGTRIIRQFVLYLPCHLSLGATNFDEPHEN